MKVLMTADAVGGVWTYGIDLARGLSERGIEVALAVMGRAPSEVQRAEALTVPGLKLYAAPCKLEWEDDPWADIARAEDWLLDLERRERPDVVHLNGYAHGASPFLAPVIVVGHSCVLSWWRAVKCEDAPPEWNRYADAVRRGLHAADAIAAPTRAMANALDRHYGPLPSAPVVIPNGRDARLFAPGSKEPYIFSAGRLWDEAKNVGALEAVAADLAWPVCTAGEGGALGRLTPAEIAGHLSRAAIYALPARYEPFGLSVLEAALSGCALVLGDIPSLRENWSDAACFVPPDDVAALRAALTRLMDRPERRAALAAAARRRAADFTIERMAARYEKLYRSLTNVSGVPARKERSLACVS